MKIDLNELDHARHLVTKTVKGIKDEKNRNLYVSRAIKALMDTRNDRNSLAEYVRNYFIDGFIVTTDFAYTHAKECFWESDSLDHKKALLKKFADQGFRYVSCNDGDPRPIGYDDLMQELWDLTDKREAQDELD